MQAGLQHVKNSVLSLGHMVTLFPNLGIFLSRMQFTSDITSKSRIKHAETKWSALCEPTPLQENENYLKMQLEKFGYSVLGQIRALVFEPLPPHQ